MTESGGLSSQEVHYAERIAIASVKCYSIMGFERELVSSVLTKRNIVGAAHDARIRVRRPVGLVPHGYGECRGRLQKDALPTINLDVGAVKVEGAPGHAGHPVHRTLYHTMMTVSREVVQYITPALVETPVADWPIIEVAPGTGRGQGD